MMKPDPPATCLRSSSSSGVRLPRGLRWPLPCPGLGKKNSNGSPPKGLCLRRSLVLMTSVDVIDTTAGMTRAATSAKDGMVTDATGVPPDVVWMADDCACEGRIRPRSALMTTPNATEAMMIAIVDRMRLVVEFMTVEAPLKRSIDVGGGPFCTAALDVPAGAAWRCMWLSRTSQRNV